MLAIGYGADYSKRTNLLLLHAYLVGVLLFSVWLMVAAAIGMTQVRWPYVLLAVGSIAIFGALSVNNTFTLEKLTESIFLTGRTAAMVCWLFVGSAIFSSVFAVLGGQGYVEKFVLSLGLNSLGFMILAQAIIFILDGRWNGPRSSSSSCRSSCRC